MKMPKIPQFPPDELADDRGDGPELVQNEERSLPPRASLTRRIVRALLRPVGLLVRYWSGSISNKLLLMVCAAVIVIGAKELIPRGWERWTVSHTRHEAEAGDAAAMFRLGELYRHGESGLPEDARQAVRWHMKAAEAGNAESMFALGRAYYDGKLGLPKRPALALSWFIKAGLAGDTDAMNFLSSLYHEGNAGVQRNDTTAVLWSKLSADAGDGQGFYDLGAMYEQGVGGLPANTFQAVSWYQKAAKSKQEAGKAEAVKALRRLGY
jgi:hypothetical protein